MFKAILRIFAAIKCAYNEKNRQRKQFKQKQSEIYSEGFTESKLRDQLMQVVTGMYKDPSITSVRIKIAKEAIQFISGVLPQLECEVVKCTDPSEFILMPRYTYV